MTTPDKAASLVTSAPVTPSVRDVLRQQLLARRAALQSDVKERWDESIRQRLLQRCAALQPGSVLGVYWPMRGEPDLGPAYATLATRGVQLALPVVVARAAPLRFAHWIPGAPLAPGTFGVPVPRELTWADPHTLLVPCLGFNSARMRLGYGGGFYDRTLARTPRPATIGIAYGCLQAEFEAASHDIALDCILTEDACG